MSGPPAGQQERTLLAWRRTSLALVGTSLVALHLALTFPAHLQSYCC